MTIYLNPKLVRLALIVLTVSLLVIGGGALAKSLAPSTEPGGDPPVFMAPSYDSANPSEALPPDENQTAAPGAPAVTFKYYQVSGATLRGRNSTAGYLYDGVGCSHVTSGTGTGMILNTELPIPDGATIKYLRVYYKDTSAATGVNGFITRYTPGVATNDLVTANSSAAFAGGYGFVVSQEITETVNNTSYVYTLIGWPGEIGANSQICGLRVAYYPPPGMALYLPVVRR